MAFAALFGPSFTRTIFGHSYLCDHFLLPFLAADRSTTSQQMKASTTFAVCFVPLAKCVPFLACAKSTFSNPWPLYLCSLCFANFSSFFVPHSAAALHVFVSIFVRPFSEVPKKEYYFLFKVFHYQSVIDQNGHESVVHQDQSFCSLLARIPSIHKIGADKMK